MLHQLLATRAVRPATLTAWSTVHILHVVITVRSAIADPLVLLHLAFTLTIAHAVFVWSAIVWSAPIEPRTGIVAVATTFATLLLATLISASAGPSWTTIPVLAAARSRTKWHVSVVPTTHSGRIARTLISALVAHELGPWTIEHLWLNTHLLRVLAQALQVLAMRFHPVSHLGVVRAHQLLHLLLLLWTQRDPIVVALGQFLDRPLDDHRRHLLGGACSSALPVFHLAEHALGPRRLVLAHARATQKIAVAVRPAAIHLTLWTSRRSAVTRRTFGLTIRSTLTRAVVILALCLRWCAARQPCNCEKNDNSCAYQSAESSIFIRPHPGISVCCHGSSPLPWACSAPTTHRRFCLFCRGNERRPETLHHKQDLSNGVRLERKRAVVLDVQCRWTAPTNASPIKNYPLL